MKEVQRMTLDDVVKATNLDAAWDKAIDLFCLRNHANPEDVHVTATHRVGSSEAKQ